MDLASLEVEAMLLGLWKNIMELEANISLPELEALLKAARDRDHRNKKFAAALKGIDIDDGPGENDARTAFDRVRARAEGMTNGKSGEEADFNYFGLAVETE